MQTYPGLPPLAKIYPEADDPWRYGNDCRPIDKKSALTDVRKSVMAVKIKLKETGKDPYLKTL